MTSPTVAQLALATPPAQSLWAFLAQLPNSMEAQILLGFMLAGILGMLGHFVVKWAYGQIAGNLIAYMFTGDKNMRRTLLATIALLSVALTAVSTGIFTTAEGVFVGWANVLWQGVLTGFGSDSVVNKGGRSIWTDEQRIAKQEPKP